MDIALYIIAIVFFVQSRKLKDNMGNYFPEGLKKKKISTICFIVAIVIDVIAFAVAFSAAL